MEEIEQSGVNSSIENQWCRIGVSWELYAFVCSVFGAYVWFDFFVVEENQLMMLTFTV